MVFLVFWQALVWLNDWPHYRMASPSDLLPAYQKYWSLFLTLGWQPLWRSWGSFCIISLSPLKAFCGLGRTVGLTSGFQVLDNRAIGSIIASTSMHQI